MSSDLTIDSDYNGYRGFVLTSPLNYSDWNGHEISWKNLPEVRSKMERRILEVYNSSNPILVFHLASLYPFHLKGILENRIKSSRKSIQRSGLTRISHTSQRKGGRDVMPDFKNREEVNILRILTTSEL